jgi:methylated-DNA-[protein]-cysteine S-methyltransferase
MRLHYSLIESPVGPLLLGVSDDGLAWLGFHRGKFPGGRFAAAEWTPSETKLKAWTRELKEYFAGKRREFDLPIDLHGTEFQVRCWRELLKIPYGETITYAELSQRVGSQNGFRAVGAANGANPVAVVVPCHRVVASDLTLGGYGGGLPAKELLLKLEGAWPLKHVTASMF